MLTKKQKEVYDFIKNYFLHEGLSPTQKEIKEHFGLKSFGSVQKYLKYLQEYGLIENEWNARRGIQLINSESLNDGSKTLPLLGSIAAGNPIEAIENSERIEVPDHLYNPTKTNFCLTISGDSMIDKGILNNDIVIIEHQKYANEGQIIAAIIDGEATLKIYQKKQNSIRLLPANKNFKPITVTNQNFSIAGVLVGLFRSY